MGLTNKPSLVDLIRKSLEDDKANDISVIELAGKSVIADAMIIASGRSQRHISALTDHLLRKLKGHGYGQCRVEGLPSCDWVLVDTGDVIVHLFKPEVREFYRLEKLWAEPAFEDRQVAI